MWWSPKARPQNSRTVRQDWRLKLPPEKNSVFSSVSSTIQSSHSVFGIVLDEGMQLSQFGDRRVVAEQASLSADLCERFVAPLCGTLDALERHARHFGTLPSVDSLKADNFRGDSTRQAARRNEVLSQVLWRQHNRFLHKLRTLHDMAHSLATVYRATVTRIIEDSSVSPRLDWAALDCIHYDLTTCLSETTVMLKSFLVALPEEELDFFSEQVAKATSAVRIVSNRRAAAFRRQ